MKRRLTAIIAGLCIAALPVGKCAANVLPSDTADIVSAAEPVRILAMGDSITHGYINGDNGYRKYLCYQLQQQGFTDFDMVGPNNNWTDSVSYTTADGVTFEYDPAHAGYSGYAIQAYSGRQGLYETVFDTTYTNGDVSGNMMEAYDPDIVLLQIGTNDLLDNHNDGITDRLETMVDKLLDSMDDQDMLFVASVPDIDVSVRYDRLWAYQSSGITYDSDPEGFTALVQQSVDNYNASVKELVEKKQADGKQIRFADINSVVDMKTGLEDGVHPNETGYACMGKYWSEQLLSYLNQTPIEPTPGSTTATVTTTTTETTTSVTASSETETTTAESTSITETETSETVSDTTETTTISSSESSTETATSQQPQPIKGDVTLDGTVNVADVVRLCRYLVHGEGISKTAYECADVTEDGIVNGFDLTLLRQMLVAAGGQEQ